MHYFSIFLDLQQQFQNLDGMSITGIKATHGLLTLKLGPFSKTVHPGLKERVGWGAIVF